jgi:hypothetical protein
VIGIVFWFYSQGVNYCCTETILIFGYWFLFSDPSLKLFIKSEVFALLYFQVFVELLVSVNTELYDLQIQKIWIFTFLLVSLLFISLDLLLCLRFQVIYWIRMGSKDNTFLIIKVKDSTFPHLVRWFLEVSIHFYYIASIHSFFRTFIMKMLHFDKSFFIGLLRLLCDFCT